MSSWKSFEELECWQVARQFNRGFWKLVCEGAFRNDKGLMDQLNRSAGSVMDNIAEGFDAGWDKEFVRFLRYSQRSCSEARSQLYRALDRNHIDPVAFEEMSQQLTEIYNKVGGLIRYLTSQKTTDK